MKTNLKMWAEDSGKYEPVQRPELMKQGWEQMEKLLNRHLPVERPRRPRWLIFLPLLCLPLLTLLHKEPVVRKQTNMNVPARPPANTDRISRAPDLSGAGVSELVSNPSGPETRSALAGVGYRETGNLQRHPIDAYQDKEMIKAGHLLSLNISERAALLPLKNIAVGPDMKLNPNRVAATKPLDKAGDLLTVRPGLSFFVSGGPEISAAMGNPAGQWKLQGGLGLQFQLNKRWALRAGIFSGRKEYEADSASYHPPASFWNYYPNLDEVDANCWTYQIPVEVQYYFHHGNRGIWHAGLGISSTIMKEENYTYYYKDTWGNPTYKDRTVKNKNRHFLSDIRISGGYQVGLGHKFQADVSPYFTLPVSGIGAGKVKLGTAGLQVSLIYSPFAH